jgi:hypothetical protein
MDTFPDKLIRMTSASRKRPFVYGKKPEAPRRELSAKDLFAKHGKLKQPPT